MNRLAPDKRPLILGVGEILWDVFPDGPRFGGAPANFACSVAGLATNHAEAGIVSAVGNDDLGRQARQTLHDRGVNTDGVAECAQPTGTVNVILNEHGHASYEFADDTAWDHIPWSDPLARLAERATAVCFGTLGQRSEQSAATIRRFVAATPPGCLRILDVNLRPPCWNDAVIRSSLELASALKCNHEELPVIAGLYDVSGTEREMLHQLIDRCGLQFAAVTRGDRGSLLVAASGSVSEVEGDDVDVLDTVGAGDAFTSALTLGILHDLDLDTIHRWASQVAAWVCSQPGATPAIPEHLRLSDVLRSSDR